MKTRIKEILTTYWGHSNFRPLQEDIILSVLEGKDTLALMPTGGGKSVCFQVPAMVNEGVCIVISPLISLIKDQVEALKNKGIPAVAIMSGMKRNEIEIALDNAAFGKTKFLYVTPERLATELFRERVQNMKVNLLAVDEAHCISQWGYDFRPPYLKIAEIRELIPGTPVLALTATATPEVQRDIQEKLNFKTENIFRKSFERKNIAYVVFHEEDKMQKLLNIISNVKGTGVIYVRNRKKTKETAEYLQKQKIKASYYHAGLNAEIRSTVQEDWMKEKVRVIVATNAFGMGIDKGNVRFVVHLDLPESPEAYFQEAGRAGRDEEKAYAVLLYNQSDIEDLTSRAQLSFPETKEVLRVYTALANYYQLPVGSGKGVSYDFDMDHFSRSYKMLPASIHHCIKILEMQGLIAQTDSIDLHSRLHIVAKYDELYDFQVRNPRFDHLIKTILRSHEGVFDDYIQVNENILCKRAELSKAELVDMLGQLEKYQMVSYVPATDAPQITFIEERLDERDVHIDRQNLAVRKERFMKRVKAMLKYTTQTMKCRSQMLLEYFGETKDLRCGVCDYCLKRNRLGVSDFEFEIIESQIKLKLVGHSLELKELVNHIKEAKQDKSIKVIEWLIDNERISYAEGNLLKWID
ncbi:RecQ family ATP-dependent DNA helicase [soil metagenome]